MNIDKECRELCKALNKVKGIQTTESCCGHGRNTYKIWFKADNLDCLPDLLYWFDGCHSGYYDWAVSVHTDCGKSPIWFMIEAPRGNVSYDESEEIARLIIEDQEDMKMGGKKWK